MFLRFALTWLVIIAMASFDTYLTVKHGPVMEDVELNPVGMVVLRTSGGVPLLVGMKTGGVALALLFSVALWQKEQLRPKVLFSSYSVATLGVGMMCFMSVDLVGMQTQRWAREMKANAIAHSKGEPLPYPGPPSSAQVYSTASPGVRSDIARPNAEGGVQSLLQPLHTGIHTDDAQLVASSDKTELRNPAPLSSDSPPTTPSALSL